MSIHHYCGFVVLRVRKVRDRKDLICQFVAIATEEGQIATEEGQNPGDNKVNPPLRFSATPHLHVRSEKVDVPVSLHRNFRFPDGKLQYRQTFVGRKLGFISGKLGIDGVKIRLQPFGGDDGRNALKHSVNAGLQCCLTYKTHTLGNVASD
jgi:hypothetical protein